MAASTRRTARKAAKAEDNTASMPIANAATSKEQEEDVQNIKEEKEAKVTSQPTGRNASKKHAKLPSSERTSKSLQQPKKVTKRISKKRKGKDDSDYRPSAGSNFDCGLRRGHT